MHRFATLPTARLATATLVLSLGSGTVLAQGAPSEEVRPITAKVGSFLAGGTVITTPPDGMSLYGDHAYVQYMIPPNARELPLVMWHGGGQFGKTWESTPDDREGFQTIFVRRGFATYVLDQPRRGRAGQTTEGTEIIPTGNAERLFEIFRLGTWAVGGEPQWFKGVQFPQTEYALEQYFRQTTVNTGPSGVEERDLISDAVVAVFDRIGPGVLITHSASGILGWLTGIKSENVKAIVSYEPGTFVFPEGELPTLEDPTRGVEVPLADFEKLTQIPIQLVFGDFIATEPSPITGPEFWRVILQAARHFVDAVNRHGGDAQLLPLPQVGLFGNTHFPFSDLNNVEVANLLQHYLHQKGLDGRAEERVASGRSR